MTKSKSSASSIVISSIFVIHLMNDAQFLNAIGIGLLCFVLTISRLSEIYASLKSERLDFKTTVLKIISILTS